MPSLTIGKGHSNELDRERGTIWGFSRPDKFSCSIVFAYFSLINRAKIREEKRRVFFLLAKTREELVVHKGDLSGMQCVAFCVSVFVV